MSAGRGSKVVTYTFRCGCKRTERGDDPHPDIDASRKCPQHDKRWRRILIEHPNDPLPKGPYD